MDKKKKKRKKGRTGLLASRFYRVYFAAVSVALVLIAIGLVWLRGAVRDYEIAQPVHAAAEVARLFEEGDYGRIYDLDTEAANVSGGDKALYVESLSKLAEGGDVAWSQSYSSDPDELKYGVTLNGSKLATFTLVPSGQTTGHGNRLWKLGQISTNVALEGTEAAGDLSAAPYRVSAPSTYTVTVNGRTLTEADAVGSGASILPEGFVPSSVVAPTMTEYAFFSEGQAPEIAATDPAGAQVSVQPDGENR